MKMKMNCLSGFLRQNLSNSTNMSFLSNWNKNTSHVPLVKTNN